MFSICSAYNVSRNTNSKWTDEYKWSEFDRNIEYELRSLFELSYKQKIIDLRNPALYLLNSSPSWRLISNSQLCLRLTWTTKWFSQRMANSSLKNRANLIPLKNDQLSFPFLIQSLNTLRNTRCEFEWVGLNESLSTHSMNSVKLSSFVFDIENGFIFEHLISTLRAEIYGILYLKLTTFYMQALIASLGISLFCIVFLQFYPFINVS